MNECQKKWALFWVRLLYPAIYSELDGGKLTHYIENLCTTEIIFPDGKRKKPSAATLWRKLAAYRREGIEGLYKKKRSDRGKSRTMSPQVLATAVDIKKELPSRSAVVINSFLEHYHAQTVPPSTLYRHLRQEGATRVKLGVSKTKVRCRWGREHSNSLWHGDFQDGPLVLIDGRAYRTYLSAFIDSHSRYVVSARYYLRENTAILIDTLLRGWQLCGKSRALHLDNAKVYYSNALELACAALQIRLLHRPPREPEPGGKIEKFFQTSQSRFESEVRAKKIMDLNELNKAFAAWLEHDYHKTVHGETEQTPQERYHQGMVEREPVDISAALRFFMLRAERTVNRGFSDVSVECRLYKVDKKLRGDKVIVRYDPFGELKEVLIYSIQDEYLGTGTLYERERKRQDPEIISPPGPLKHDYLALLTEKQERQLSAQSRGIDFTEALRNRPWPFLSFVGSLARLMGRKGGASAFNAGEYEALNRIYNRNPNLVEPVLMEAFSRANIKDIVNIAYQLQQLRKE